LSHQRATFLLTIAAGLLAGDQAKTTHGAESSKAPNVLIVLADDLGYSDLGCYGSEIHTPNLDSLAKSGLRFTQFYNTARCWPTRGALLTGYYAQQIRRDTVPGIASGGRGVRPKWAPLLPQLLRPLGYRSYHSGKWHVDGMPLAGGFDRSYLLQDQGRFFSPQVHSEDDRKLPPVEPGSDYYATTAIADHAIKCLKEHAADHAGKPFFHYLAFTAPHFPLHALPEDYASDRPGSGRPFGGRARSWPALSLP
jgi:arylsulfatase